MNSIDRKFMEKHKFPKNEKDQIITSTNPIRLPQENTITNSLTLHPLNNGINLEKEKDTKNQKKNEKKKHAQRVKYLSKNERHPLH